MPTTSPAGRVPPALAALLIALSLAACRGPREAAEAPAASAEARVEAIRARAADRAAFDLAVGVRSLARGPISGRLGAGDAVAGGQPYDAFVTELRAGATLTADLRSEDFAPVLAVITPSGATALGHAAEVPPQSEPPRAHLAMEVAEPGLYMLLVMPSVGQTGGVYQLDVETAGPVVAYPPELLR